MMMSPPSHSFPTIHWWLSLNAAEQSAWVAGLGAFAAAGAALLISGREQGRRKREIKQQARIAASYLYTDIAYLARDSVFVRRTLLEWSKLPDSNGLAGKISELRQILLKSRGIVGRIDLEKIGRLPEDIGTSLGLGLGGFTPNFDEVEVVLFQIEYPTRAFKEIRGILVGTANRLDDPISNALTFLAWFNKEFSMPSTHRASELHQSLLAEMAEPVITVDIK